LKKLAQKKTWKAPFPKKTTQKRFQERNTAFSKHNKTKQEGEGTRDF